MIRREHGSSAHVASWPFNKTSPKLRTWIFFWHCNSAHEYILNTVTPYYRFYSNGAERVSSKQSIHLPPWKCIYFKIYLRNTQNVVIACGLLLSKIFLIFGVVIPSLFRSCAEIRGACGPTIRPIFNHCRQCLRNISDTRLR